MHNRQMMFCGRRKGEIVQNHECSPACPVEENNRQKLADHYNGIRAEVLLKLKEQGVFEPLASEVYNAASEQGFDTTTAFAIAAQVVPAQPV